MRGAERGGVLEGLRLQKKLAPVVGLEQDDVDDALRAIGREAEGERGVAMRTANCLLI